MCPILTNFIRIKTTLSILKYTVRSGRFIAVKNSGGEKNISVEIFLPFKKQIRSKFPGKKRIKRKAQKNKY